MNTCLKYIFVIINILFVIIGALCIGFVFWSKAIKLIDDTLINLQLSAPLFYFGILLGGFLVLLGLCGTLGACSGKKLLLGIYIGTVVFLVLCELGGLIYSLYVGRTTIVENFENIWNETLTNDVKEDVQRTFKCCGYANSSEWTVPPESCYGNTSEGETNGNSTSSNSTDENLTSNGLWKNSCSESVLNWFRENILVFGGALAATLLFQVFQIVVTALLIRAIIVPNQVKNQGSNSDQMNRPNAPSRERPRESYSNASFVQDSFYDDSRGKGMQIKKQQPTKVNKSEW